MGKNVRQEAAILKCPNQYLKWRILPSLVLHNKVKFQLGMVNHHHSQHHQPHHHQPHHHQPRHHQPRHHPHHSHHHNHQNQHLHQHHHVHHHQLFNRHLLA